MLANIGYDGSLKWLKELYVDGKASKEDYAGALRAYQAAVNAAKSREREEANSLYNKARGAAQKKELRVSSPCDYQHTCRHFCTQSV